METGKFYLDGHYEERLRRIIEDRAKREVLVEQKGEVAQAWLDHLQELADNPKTSSQLRFSILAIMLRLSKKSGLHSRCLTLQNVRKLGHYPVASGGFGDVWKGVIGSSSAPVCLKVVKLYLNSDVERLCKAYLREAIVWRQLKHSNVLPFLGIYFLENSQHVCLISPWMEKGNLVQYVRLERSRGNIECYSLVYDVANGLSYLHSRKVVHGDLKGVNILITRSGRACIGDFGLSRVAETQELHLTTSTTRPVGTSRWLAPELLNGGRTSKESDIYAYGCVCYEIFTGLHPFPDLLSDGAVVLHVVQGKHSSRPKDAAEPDDSMWAIMKSCWSLNPPARPTADEILSKIQRYTLDPVVAELDQIDTLSREIWNNVEREPLSIIPEFESPEQSDSRHSSTLPSQHPEHNDTAYVSLPNSHSPDSTPSKSSSQRPLLPPPPQLRNTEGGTSQASTAPLQWKKKPSQGVYLDRQPTSLSDDVAKLSVGRYPKSGPESGAINGTIATGPAKPGHSKFPLQSKVISFSNKGKVAPYKWVRGELVASSKRGRLYLALSTITGEMMVVKQLDLGANSAKKPSFVQKKKIKIEKWINLYHPNVVECLGFEETLTHFNIFFENVPGGSMHAFLVKHGELSEENTKFFTRQILCGLDYLHSNGVSHGNLQTKNILMELNGVCKLYNLDSTKQNSWEERELSIASHGPMFWIMAPEVKNPQKEIDKPKVDIWGVGCMVLAMLSGKDLWEYDEITKMMRLNENEPPPVPHNAVLSPLADDFRWKCFAMSPDERPSAAELLKQKYLEMPLDWEFEGWTRRDEYTMFVNR